MRVQADLPSVGQMAFKLHGWMGLNIAFGERTMVTPVCIKMDAHDQLLLSEGACRQLEIIRYHPEVDKVNGLKKTKPPTVCVQLVWSFLFHPQQSTIVSVRANGVRSTHVL